MTGRTEGYARFERIAEVYDETREPLDTETLGALVLLLGREGYRDLLEVGVGTGRIGRPLADAGFRVTGVDPARNMIRRARAKGLERLVRGSGEALPFRDDSFDVSLFVHVFHVLPNPGHVLRRAGRVSRRSVLALLTERSEFSMTPEVPGTTDPSRLLREAFQVTGIARPTRSNPSVAERKTMRQLPPDGEDLLSDRWVMEPFERHLERLAHRGNPGGLEPTREHLQRAIESVRRSIGNPLLRYRRRYVLARWDAERLKMSDASTMAD